MADERVEVADYSFPAEAEPLEELLYRIPFGDDVTRDLKWEAYIDVSHQLGVEKLETEIADSGVDDDGIRYAAVKVTVVTDDGETYSSLGSADQTTNQVHDPEHVWTVAESRAVKRAVKKAFNIYPVKSEASDEPAPKGDVEGPKGGGGVSTPDNVEYDDGHALADNAGASSADVGDDDVEW